MCGALGTDQEGCLISCVQCGQCYHPYCLNVKVTKVILQKGWRCLDCTVCEGCGQRNDEGRLLLCDDCDVSYHTYCMDPPLEYVPHGNWKCKVSVRLFSQKRVLMVSLVVRLLPHMRYHRSRVQQHMDEWVHEMRSLCVFSCLRQLQ